MDETHGDEPMDNSNIDPELEDATEDSQNISMPNFPPLHVRRVFAATIQDLDDSDSDTGNDDINEDEAPLEDPRIG